MIRIEWTNKSLDELYKLDQTIAHRILKKVNELPNKLLNIKRLKGEKAYRLRVGDYRVVFDVHKDTISILKVGHRKNIYD